MAEATSKQSIEELKKRYEELNDKKIRAEENLKYAEEILAKLKQKAREEYGTDNIVELGAELERKETENERKRSDYQLSLDTIEANLKEAERKYAEVKDANKKA